MGNSPVLPGVSLQPLPRSSMDSNDIAFASLRRKIREKQSRLSPFSEEVITELSGKIAQDEVKLDLLQASLEKSTSLRHEAVRHCVLDRYRPSIS